MIRPILRFLLKQKLLIGVLWLMLRGNVINAQSLTRPTHLTCYRSQPQHPFLHKRDISLSQSFRNTSLNEQFTTFSFGLNNNNFTFGLTLKENNTTSELFVGPDIRWFPLTFITDSSGENSSYPNKWTFFTEAEYSFEILADQKKNIASFSLGMIYSVRNRFGIELFESALYSFESSKTGFYSGVRIHYYTRGY